MKMMIVLRDYCKGLNSYSKMQSHSLESGRGMTWSDLNFKRITFMNSYDMTLHVDMIWHCSIYQFTKDRLAQEYKKHGFGSHINRLLLTAELDNLSPNVKILASGFVD